jgi:hypothetical protein
MKLVIQILFLLLTWLTNLTNATPVFTKAVLQKLCIIIPGVTQGSFVGIAVDDVTSNMLKIADSKQFTMYSGQAKTVAKNASLSVRSSIEVIEDLGNGIQFC